MLRKKFPVNYSLCLVAYRCDCRLKTAQKTRAQPRSHGGCELTLEMNVTSHAIKRANNRRTPSLPFGSRVLAQHSLFRLCPAPNSTAYGSAATFLAFKNNVFSPFCRCVHAPPNKRWPPKRSFLKSFAIGQASFRNILQQAVQISSANQSRERIMLCSVTNYLEEGSRTV